MIDTAREPDELADDIRSSEHPSGFEGYGPCGLRAGRHIGNEMLRVRSAHRSQGPPVQPGRTAAIEDKIVHEYRIDDRRGRSCGGTREKYHEYCSKREDSFHITSRDGNTAQSEKLHVGVAYV